MTPYERDEKRTRMRMNKIMGWNIWREHKEEQREGFRGEKNAKHLLWSACNEGYMSPNQQLRDNHGKNCRATFPTHAPCTAVCVVEAVTLRREDSPECVVHSVSRHYSISNTQEAIRRLRWSFEVVPCELPLEVSTKCITSTKGKNK